MGMPKDFRFIPNLRFLLFRSHRTRPQAGSALQADVMGYDSKRSLRPKNLRYDGKRRCAQERYAS
jgi:hypothetical protein